jgi:hypothetical protein
MRQFLSFSIFFLTLWTIPCLTFAQKANIIRESCDLALLLGDTVIVEGRYSMCMEYSGFSTIKNDSCSENMGMELSFQHIQQNSKLDKVIAEIRNYGCGATVKLVLQGVVFRDQPDGYGHAGSNQAKMVVTNVLKVGRVKTK